MQVMRRPLILVFALTSALGLTQTTWVHSDFASKQIEAYREHHAVPGLSIAVAVKGQIVFAKGFGFGDLERQSPVRTTDYFRLASVSKPITSTLIFELAEQGKLNLDAPIRQVVPELPAHHTYRVRDLLSHQSGVRHYGVSDPPLRNYLTSLSALDRFAKDPLLFEPGEKFSYSTHAFTILGAAIEKITKKPYRIYAAERLNSWGVSGLQCESGSNPNRTKVYGLVDKKNRAATRDDLSWKYPGGGYEATAIGLCQFGLAVAQGKILKRETLNQAWTVPKPRTGPSTMAYGWSTSNAGGHKAVQHGGSQLGANSNLRIQIDEQTVVVVLSNRSGHEPGQLAEYLARLTYLGKDDKLPEIKLD
jgi:serine beta-lactamase-like protein LACTB, mitochondrial